MHAFRPVVVRMRPQSIIQIGKQVVTRGKYLVYCSRRRGPLRTPLISNTGLYHYSVVHDKIMYKTHSHNHTLYRTKATKYLQIF